MAYARYDRTCEWYIFWQYTLADEEHARTGTPKPKAEEVLAIWHIDHRFNGPAFTYPEVCEMLERSDFARIPGYADAHRSLIIECLSEFVQDVEDEHGAA